MNQTLNCYLVINEQLNGVITPLYQHNLVGLPRNTVREGGSDPWAGAGLDPHAEGEGVHLRQALGDAAEQVVGPLGEGQLKLLGGLKISSS